MTDARSDKERWHILMDVLSDDIAQMSDEMVLREFAEDAKEDIRKVSMLIHDLIGKSDVTPYEATKAALKAHRSKTTKAALPKTPRERRALVELIMGGRHPWSELATLAFRDLDEPSRLPDEEIQSILEDLAELNENGGA